MNNRKYIIIGAGAAGTAAARTVRQTDPGAEVVLLGEERFFPYNRFLLTDFLCGTVSEEPLIYMSAETFLEMGVVFRKGEYVKSIEPAEKVVRLSHNEVLPYDKLLIATGGTPGLGPVLQPFQEHIRRYYALEDVYLLKRRLHQIETCIVFGDGPSSLDLLRGLTATGKKVTYIYKGARPDWFLTDTALYDDLQALLLERGVELIAEDRIISIEKRERGYHVLTFKQRELTADVVFAWDHYQPNLSIIKGTGIESKLGILVDEYMRTSVEDIYAAGDCVEIYHPKLKNYWINFGWPNALAQGAAAGKNMAGGREKYNIRETIVLNLMGKPVRARWWK